MLKVPEINGLACKYLVGDEALELNGQEINGNATKGMEEATARAGRFPE